MFIPNAIAHEDALSARDNVNAILHADEFGEFVSITDSSLKWTVDKLKYALHILAWNGCRVAVSALDSKQLLVRKLDEAVQFFIVNKLIARELPAIGQFSLPVTNAPLVDTVNLPSSSSTLGGTGPVVEILGGPSRSVTIGVSPVLQLPSSSSRDVAPVAKKVGKRKVAAAPSVGTNGTGVSVVNSGSTVGDGNRTHEAGGNLIVTRSGVVPPRLPLPVPRPPLTPDDFRH
jgi:hypothetical protein